MAIVRWLSKNIGRRLTTAMVLLAFGFSLALGVTSFIYTQSLVEKSIFNELNGESVIAARTLSQVLNAYANATQGLAENPLVVNALLDSQERETYLTPFIRSYHLGGGADINLTLTDFSGKPIANKGPARDYANEPWKARVVDEGHPVAVISARDQRVVLLLAYPVVFPSTGFAEGMLIVEIDMHVAMTQSLGKFSAESSINLNSLDGVVSLNLNNASGDATSFSARTRLDVSSPIDEIGLLITASKSVEYVQRPLHNLIYTYLLLGFGLLGAVLLLANWLSRRLTLPITQLSEFAHKVTENHELESIVPWKGEDEVGVLAQTLETMLRRLRNARDDLERTVEVRTHELQGTLSQLNALIANNPVGILFENDDQCVVLCNEQITKLLSLDVTIDVIRETRYENLTTLLTKCVQDEEAFAIKIEQRRKERVPVTNEEIQMSDGRTLERDYVPIWVENTFLGHMWLYRDVSERKKVDRLKSEFVSVVSHELRTPLTSIRGSLALLAGDVVGTVPPQIRKLITIALRNSERLVMLVNDILDMDKINSGNMRFDIKPHSLIQLLNQALQDNKAYGDEYNVTFKFISALPDIKVLTDSDRFLQIMSNLLSNAAKFSPENSVVEVDVAHTGPTVRIAVRDHGQGIPEEFRDRLFHKFSQADSTDTRQKGGSGLGLAITKALVEKMDGSVGFETVTGDGTTFCVTFKVFV